MQSDKPGNPAKWAEEQRKVVFKAIKSNLERRMVDAGNDQRIVVRLFIVAMLDGFLWWLNHTPSGSPLGDDSAGKDRMALEVMLDELAERAWSYGAGKLSVRGFEATVSEKLKAKTTPRPGYSAKEQKTKEHKEKMSAEQLAAFYDPSKW